MPIEDHRDASSVPDGHRRPARARRGGPGAGRAAAGDRAAALAVLAVASGVAWAVGGTPWLLLTGPLAFAIAWGAGSVIDQLVATSIAVAFSGAVAWMLPVVAPSVGWLPPAGVGAGLAAGWLVSAVAEWGLGARVR